MPPPAPSPLPDDPRAYTPHPGDTGPDDPRATAPRPSSDPGLGGPRPRAARPSVRLGRLVGFVCRVLRLPGVERRRGDPEPRLVLELENCRQQRDRWRRHADSYERELTRFRHERAHLLAWLAALHPSSAVLTDGGGTLFLRAGERGVSWPLSPAELPLFAHVPYAEPAAPTDVGEAEQAAHIREHTRLLAIEDILSAGSGDHR